MKDKIKLGYGILSDAYPNVSYRMHPRWYFSHGGINPNSKGWKFMLNDYAHIMNIPLHDKEKV